MIVLSTGAVNTGARATMQGIVQNGWQEEAMGGVKKMMTVMDVVRKNMIS